MSKKDYYQVLDLTPACTTQDVRKNYHKLALVWHPDKHVNKSEAQHRFTEIHEAYSILTDAKKRKIYDTSGHQGLVKDHEIQDFTSCGGQNLFYQKGFNGSNKSAFDVLKGIFEEKEEDDFFRDCSTFDFSDAFKANIKSFINDGLMSSENEEGESFCKSYKPTFMDNNFFSTPPIFQTSMPQNECTTHTEFFSFFTSTDSEFHSYSRTSTTFLQKGGKMKTSTKQRVQQCESFFEDEHNLEFLEAQLGQDYLFDSDCDFEIEFSPRKPKKNKKKKTQIIAVEDGFPINNKIPKAKNSSQNKKKHDRNKKECRFLDFEVMADDENELVECGEMFRHQGNQKKNKK